MSREEKILPYIRVQEYRYNCSGNGGVRRVNESTMRQSLARLKDLARKGDIYSNSF